MENPAPNILLSGTMSTDNLQVLPAQAPIQWIWMVPQCPSVSATSFSIYLQLLSSSGVQVSTIPMVHLSTNDLAHGDNRIQSKGGSIVDDG